jgi:hypothetical protein
MSNRLKIFLLLACIIMAVTSTVYSLPTGGRYIAYFADSTFTDVVGERDLECGSGQWWEWGTRTGYYRNESWSCQNDFSYTCSETLCMGYVPSDPNNWVDNYSCQTFSCNGW